MPNDQEETAGASMLKSALNSYRHDLPPAVGIFDYDIGGKKEYNSLSKQFEASHISEDCECKMHKNKNVAAICLPCIQSRSDHYNVENLSIEWYFPDEYLEYKCSNGYGLYFEQKEKKVVIDNKPVDSIETTESCYRVIRGDKVHFAKEIVNKFPAEAFHDFRILFEQLHILFSELLD